MCVCACACVRVRVCVCVADHAHDDTLLFSGASHRIDCTKPIELNQTRKGPYAPKKLLSERNNFLLLLLSFFFLSFLFFIFIFFFFSSSVYGKLLKGLVYPLAVKARNVLDLIHQKECVTLGYSLI